MSDDTTTWLKKNPVINPLRRSLKTSLRFHVNATEMDASIMSNPGKTKELPIIVPRVLQRPSLRMRMLQGNEFKVPGKSGTKPEPTVSKAKNDEKPGLPRKSLLPVKNKLHSSEKKVISNSVVRASFLLRNSGKKNTCRHDLMQKMMEAVKNNAMNQMRLGTETAESGDASIIRSILKKKRTSLRKSLITSSGQKKPKPVKKVLFEGFETTGEDEKENESIVYPVVNQSDTDFAALDEPTVFLNFPKSEHLESSPVSCDLHQKQPKLNGLEETESSNENTLAELLNDWNKYLVNLNQLGSMRNSLRDTIQVHLEQSQTLHNQFKSYMKTCDDLYGEMSRLGKVLEENLKKVLTIERPEDNSREITHSAEKRKREKAAKIGLSDKSRAIKKTSTRTNSTLKSGFWRSQGSEEGFSLVETKGVLNK